MTLNAAHDGPSDAWLLATPPDYEAEPTQDDIDRTEEREADLGEKRERELEWLRECDEAMPEWQQRHLSRDEEQARLDRIARLAAEQGYEEVASA